MGHHSRVLPEQREHSQLLDSKQPGTVGCLLAALYACILPMARGGKRVGEEWHVAANGVGMKMLVLAVCG